MAGNPNLPPRSHLLEYKQPTAIEHLMILEIERLAMLAWLKVTD
jgi:hypothetical protein